MANFLTALRILCGVMILGCPVFSGQYFLLFLLGGLTDAADGAAARRLGTASEAGAKLDTAADFVFFSSVLIRLACAAVFPAWLLCWSGIILLIKLSGVLAGFVRHRRFITVHTALNRLCGAAVYACLLLAAPCFPRPLRIAAAALACIVCTAAAVHEFRLILSGTDIP